MSHQCADVITAWLANMGGKPSDHVLDAGVAIRGRSALSDDARGLYYSAALSFVGAMEGIRQARFSWSTVQLYYAAFYAARSILASNAISIFYDGTKPFSVTVSAGSRILKEKGTTHKLVWGIFKREFGNHPLMNPIDGVDANEWLTKLRETANYKNARFPDPLIPTYFDQLDANGIGASLQAYAADRTMLFAFDPDHAVVAFPLECMKVARSAYLRSGIELDDEELAHIRSGCTSIGAGKNVVLC